MKKSHFPQPANKVLPIQFSKKFPFEIQERSFAEKDMKSLKHEAINYL